MPRRPRLRVRGAVYHVMARGNRKSTIFHDDEDRQLFVEVLERVVTSYHLRIMAYCLMGNHYHCVLDSPESNLSEAMQYVNGVFAQRFNRRHHLTGHVFEGRFRSLIVQRESYLKRVARYVVRNPVRAGLRADAASWAWSSYLATAGLGPAPTWLHVDWIRWAFKTDSLAEARRRYVEYVSSPAEPKPRIELNGMVLGTTQFRTRLLERARVEPDRLWPVLVKLKPRPSLAELFTGRPAPSSRDKLIYIARVEHGYCFTEIAAFLGIDRSTASKAADRCHRPTASA